MIGLLVLFSFLLFLFYRKITNKYQYPSLEELYSICVSNRHHGEVNEEELYGEVNE